MRYVEGQWRSAAERQSKLQSLCHEIVPRTAQKCGHGSWHWARPFFSSFPSSFDMRTWSCQVRSVTSRVAGRARKERKRREGKLGSLGKKARQMQAAPIPTTGSKSRMETPAGATVEHQLSGAVARPSLSKTWAISGVERGRVARAAADGLDVCI